MATGTCAKRRGGRERQRLPRCGQLPSKEAAHTAVDAGGLFS